MQMYIKYLCISESFYNDANLLHMPVRGLWRLVHVAPSGETHVAPSGETHAAPSGETHVAPSGERHERRVRRPSPIAHAALSGGRARLPPAVGTVGAPWRRAAHNACGGVSRGLYDWISSSRRLVVGCHFSKPALFCRKMTSVPWNDRTFSSLLQRNRNAITRVDTKNMR